MGRFLIAICILFFSNSATAQFWTEDFGNGTCAQSDRADLYASPNGNYSMVYQTTAANEAHAWYISAREAFTGLNNCGNGCLNPPGTLDNKTLHVSTTAGAGDSGADYNPDSVVAVTAFTPVIPTSLLNNLRIEFDYLLGGDTSDIGTVIVSNSTSFPTTLFSVPLDRTNIGGCAGSGEWVHKVIYLSTAFNNQLDLILGFKFESDGNSTGSGISLAIDNIEIFESLPLTNFTVSKDSVCDGGCVIFEDSTAGNPTSLSWNFGPNANPTVAAGAGPYTVCFSIPGTYPVTLNATNSIGTVSETKNITVVTCTPPTPAFSSSDTGLCQNQCINFFDLSAPGSFGKGEWTWQFQGATPNVSNAQNPTNICYSNTGLYNITLTVVDTVSGESATSIFTDFIEVGTCAVPTASFDSDTNQICNNDFIEFYSTSTGTPDSISWFFEGGNPTVVSDTAYDAADTLEIYYPVAGVYDVVIKVWNDGGVVFDTLFDYVIVNDCPDPEPEFTVSDQSPCPGVPIVFEDNSLYATEWYWEFPGGTPSTATTPTVVNVVYDSAGIYPVILTVKNVNGEVTLVEEGFIQVDSCLGPRPRWSVESDSICRGSCVEFFNTSLRADSIIWIFWLHPDTALAGDTIDSLTPGYEWIREGFPLVSPDTVFYKDRDYYPMIPPIINDSSPIFCFDDSLVIGVSMIAYNKYEVVAEHSPDLPILAVGGVRPTADAGPNKTILVDNTSSRFYIEDTTNFEGVGTGKYVGWFPEEGLSCYDCPTPIVYPTDTRKYYFTAYDDYGCQAYDSVIVFVDQSYHAGIPNIFSPNGDNNNDILWLRGNSIADEGFVMRIWDRYGNVVYEAFNQNDGWDGTIKGEEAPAGSYTYYVKFTFLNSKQEILTGNVTLVRY